MSHNIVLVGIAGGSGSGKTTIARNIIQTFSYEEAILLEQDSYYKDLAHLSLEERHKKNFDHPDAIDFDLLISHLSKLKEKQSICRPSYDFVTHTRAETSKTINPAHIIIVEGILIFANKALRDMFDFKIFVDTDAEERLLRRIERDMNERGRSLKSIRDQYLSTVKPSYVEFSKPTKQYADLIIPRGGENLIAINMVITKLRSILESK